MVPDYIFNIPSLMSKSDLESIFELAYKLPKNSNILEIGCFLGSTTCTIKEASPTCKLHCVDTWPDEIHSKYLTGKDDRKFSHVEITSNKFDWFQHTKHLEDVFTYQMASLRFYPEIKFDFIFLDGNHQYVNVKSELIKFKNYLKPNGILAGHDYGFEPTTKAIIEFAHNNNLALWTKNDNIWYVEPYKEIEK